MKTEIRNLIKESENWTSFEIEDLAETLLFKDTIGKNYNSIDEDQISAEYFVLNGFSRRI